MADPIISTRPNGTIRSQRSRAGREFQHTIGGLLTKRSSVAHERNLARAAYEKLEADVDALDRTLALVGFTDNPDKYMPVRKNRRIFKKGEMLRSAYDLLREADGPLSSRDIAIALLEARGFDTGDKKHVNQVTSRVYKALLREQEAGRVEGRKLGQVMVWRTENKD